MIVDRAGVRDTLRGAVSDAQHPRLKNQVVGRFTHRARSAYLEFIRETRAIRG